MSQGAIVSLEEFFSFQVEELARTTKKERMKHPFWWESIKEGFTALPEEKKIEICALANQDLATITALW